MPPAEYGAIPQPDPWLLYIGAAQATPALCSRQTPGFASGGGADFTHKRTSPLAEAPENAGKRPCWGSGRCAGSTRASAYERTDTSLGVSPPRSPLLRRRPRTHLAIFIVLVHMCDPFFSPMLQRLSLEAIQPKISLFRSWDPRRRELSSKGGKGPIPRKKGRWRRSCIKFK